MDTETLLRLVREAVRAELGATLRPTLVNFSEAARELGVSPKHVSRMVRRGSLMVVDVDGARRIPMSEIRRIEAGPIPSSSGATKERVAFDAEKARQRLRELRSKKPPPKR
jgi:hypothetical protein